MALVAVTVFVLLGIVGVSTLLFLTRSDYGREQLRSAVQPFIASKLKGGQVYIGRVRRVSTTEITVDTFAIRDKRGELFVSTGRVTAGFDLRDIVDQRIYIRRAASSIRTCTSCSTRTACGTSRKSSRRRTTSRRSRRTPIVGTSATTSSSTRRGHATRRSC